MSLKQLLGGLALAASFLFAPAVGHAQKAEKPAATAKAKPAKAAPWRTGRRPASMR